MLHLGRADLVETRGQSLEQCLFFVGRDSHVNAGGVELAGLFLQIGQDLHQGLLFGGHQLSHEQAGQDSVLLGHVTFHAETPGLFATHDDGFGFH